VAGGRAGVFLAIASQDGDKLVSASAPGAASSVQIIGGPVPVPAVGSADLTGPVPRVVMNGLANPLQGGELVTLNLTFAEAGTIAMTVPVQPKAYEYATFSPPATPSPTATKKRAKANPSASASASGSASPGATASPTATPTP
jgi:hypothetical protein